MSRQSLINLITTGLLIFSASAMAQTDETRSVRSISYDASSKIDQTTRDDKLKQSSFETLQPVSKESYRIESTAVAIQSEKTVSATKPDRMHSTEFRILSGQEFPTFVRLPGDSLRGFGSGFGKCHASDWRFLGNRL